MNLVNYAKENPLLTFLIIVNIYLLYKHNSKSYEKMTDTDSINEKIRKVYQADIESIRNLASVSKKLQEDGLTIPGDLTVDGKFNYLPRGSIIAFNGPTAPLGWALCDGTNGTPDLRGRFIRMFNDNIGGFNGWGGKVIGGNKTSYSADIGGNSRADKNSWMLKHKFGDRAGTDTQVLNTDELPPHSHPHNHGIWGGALVWGDGRHSVTKGTKTGYGSGALHRLQYNTQGATGNNQNVGKGWGHNNQPPYYVLSYIMKL